MNDERETMTDDNETEPKVRHLTDFGVEHMLGVKHGPLVKVEVADTEGLTLRGDLSPAMARRIAGHLVEAAARAEYEADLYAQMKDAGWEDRLIGGILMMVRAGEEDRLTKQEAIDG
jgi:hypothetical protein